MTFWTLIRRSLRFHVRSHVGVVLGAAIGTAALIGALLVGDSVRGTLRNRALQRLAGAAFAMTPTDRFFSQQTGSNVQPSLLSSVFLSGAAVARTATLL